MRILVHRTCSKSVAALDDLHDRGYRPEVIAYREPGVLTRALLEEVERGLGQPLRSVLRSGEASWSASQSVPDESLYDYVITHPELLERPIVLVGARALVARPPRSVWELVPDARLRVAHNAALPSALGASSEGGWTVVLAGETPVAARLAEHVIVAEGWADYGVARLLSDDEMPVNTERCDIARGDA